MPSWNFFLALPPNFGRIGSLMARGPLDGIRLIEVSEWVSGPYCGKLLAELGAEVTKVETPVGDPARRLGPFPQDNPDPEKSALFLYLNTSKSGVTINLEHPEGNTLFQEMLREADVLVLDKQPHERQRLGLEYPALRQANPALVVTSITPFGLTGPYSNYRTYHLNRYHAGGNGYLITTGKEYLDRPPLQGPGFLADYQSGLGAAIATLGAVYVSRLTGEGQEIDCSQQEWCLGLDSIFVNKYPNEGILVSRAQMGYAIGGVMPCKDGYVMLMLVEGHHWDRLMEAMGAPPWSKEERFGTQYSRTQNGDEVNRRIAEFLMQHTREEIGQWGLDRGIPVGPIASPREAMDSEQFRSRDFFQILDHSRAGSLPYPGIPFKSSLEVPTDSHAAPLLGQHTADVLFRLGYSGKEVARFRAKGAI